MVASGRQCSSRSATLPSHSCSANFHRCTVCPIVENPDLVLQEISDFQGLTHSKPAECGSRQATVGSDHPNTVASPSRGVTVDMHQVAPASLRPFCNEVHKQITTICVTSSRPMHSAYLGRFWTSVNSHQ